MKFKIHIKFLLKLALFPWYWGANFWTYQYSYSVLTSNILWNKFRHLLPIDQAMTHSKYYTQMYSFFTCQKNFIFSFNFEVFDAEISENINNNNVCNAKQKNLKLTPSSVRAKCVVGVLRQDTLSQLLRWQEYVTVHVRFSS